MHKKYIFKEKKYEKKYLFLISFFLVSDLCFAYYGDVSVAVYAGKAHGLDLDYSITQLKNEFIRINKNSGRTTYKITKLTENEQ